MFASTLEILWIKVFKHTGEEGTLLSDKEKLLEAKIGNPL